VAEGGWHPPLAALTPQARSGGIFVLPAEIVSVVMRAIEMEPGLRPSLREIGTALSDERSSNE